MLATTTRVVADPFADDKKPPLPGSPGGDEFIETLCSFYDFFIHRCCQPRQQWIRFQLDWIREDLSDVYAEAVGSDAGKSLQLNPGLTPAQPFRAAG